MIATRNISILMCMNQKPSKHASRLGGLARNRKYGNPGTLAGRRRGGLNSLKTHRLLKTGFKLLRPVASPSNSDDLAELLGILAGDGNIDEYQVTVTTNSETDIEHARHAASLFEKLFDVPPAVRFRKNQKACVVVISSKALCLLLVRKGMVRGHKIKSGLQMPPWVRSRKKYRLAFVRGLFDTDGCVYIDTHRIRGRIYKNMGIAFTNRCLPLLAEFKATLESLGLHPTQKTKYVVFLRRKKDIRLYFDVVGSSNPKHLRKVEQYFSSRYGGVG